MLKPLFPESANVLIISILSFDIKLNQRQLLFIKRLQLGLDVKAANLVKFWNVSMRTAERDISVLINHGIIKFVGAKKTGRFRLMDIMPS